MDNRNLSDLLPRTALGGAALGGLYTHVDDAEAVAVVHSAVQGGMRYIDTAPLYGHGVSESRIGDALRSLRGSRPLLSTKVGVLIQPAADDASEVDIFADAPPGQVTRDYSRAGVRRSIESSLERLGVDSLDIAYVHDPEQHMPQALSESISALEDLRSEGVVKWIGVGTNRVDVPPPFIDLGLVDVILLAGRWTLLDRSGLQVLDACHDAGVPVVLGGIMNSGLLANPDSNRTYDYAPAPDHLIHTAQAMRQAADDYSISLSALAMQHGFRHPAVASVLVGCRNRAEVTAAIEASGRTVPGELWAKIDGLAADLGTQIAQ